MHATVCLQQECEKIYTYTYAFGNNNNKKRSTYHHAGYAVTLRTVHNMGRAHNIQEDEKALLKCSSHLCEPSSKALTTLTKKNHPFIFTISPQETIKAPCSQKEFSNSSIHTVMMRRRPLYTMASHTCKRTHILSSVPTRHRQRRKRGIKNKRRTAPCKSLLASHAYTYEKPLRPHFVGSNQASSKNFVSRVGIEVVLNLCVRSRLLCRCLKEKTSFLPR